MPDAQMVQTIRAVRFRGRTSAVAVHFGVSGPRKPAERTMEGDRTAAARGRCRAVAGRRSSVMKVAVTAGTVVPVRVASNLGCCWVMMAQHGRKHQEKGEREIDADKVNDVLS